ncbi:MAG TPA: L,D-transpeptidase [Devosiaceae bacterium]|jgi:lipoprotein-anchoring transpeptidase ErfK/SrfK|nr:L,D-transpeptidase [Devosiaceae bacterium]
MRIAMITFATAFAANMMSGALAQEPTVPPAEGVAAEVEPALSPEAINNARIEDIIDGQSGTTDASVAADPAVVKLQILLDRAGASPGVIDGIIGENVEKAIMAFEEMQNLEADGELDPEVISRLETSEPVIGHYTIAEEDRENVRGEPLPEDYSELAELDFLGYESLEEKLAELFHMDRDLFGSLNTEANFEVGERILVAAYGPPREEGEVARIEADKSLGQVRAYDADGNLLVAYPATIGSEQTPSPSGTHEVEAIAPMPNYTYDPDENFQQGDNTEKLVLPPGPNGPVGSMWIDLSEPTYGIHGTPDPELIDKVASHGCVRLTNWDAEELAGLTEAGVTVEFVGG